ncbi:polygalacturonase [Fragilaria crotonensis]|nr:polygalacturonase [Fragilaria crotonensis]
MMLQSSTTSWRLLLLCTVALLIGLATGQSVSVDTYGAVGDGVTDDTDALNLAFSLAPPGSTLLIPAGRTYAHSDIVEITVPSLLIKGGGRLLATNEARSGVWINADRVIMDDIVLEMKSTTTRWMGYEQMKLRLMNSRGIVVRGVTIEGAAAAGIYVGNTHDYLIDRVTVRNTRSDAIHNTEASSFGTIVRPGIFNSGDDGVAFVSYRRDGSQVNNMVLQSPKFRLQKIGRGFSVVGSRDIVMNDLYAEDSDAASLYVGSEPYFDTFGVSNVQVNGGLFYRSNKNQEWDRQGSVHIFNGRPDEVIRNININNIRSVNTIGNQPHEVGIQSSGSGGVFGVVLRDMTMSGGPSKAFYSESPSSSYRTLQWVQNGQALSDQGSFVLGPLTTPPSAARTNSPINAPTNRPTSRPTKRPTSRLSSAPTNAATGPSTNGRFVAPTRSPTARPTTRAPTRRVPTKKPNKSKNLFLRAPNNN